MRAIPRVTKPRPYKQPGRPVVSTDVFTRQKVFSEPRGRLPPLDEELLGKVKRDHEYLSTLRRVSVDRVKRKGDGRPLFDKDPELPFLAPPEGEVGGYPDNDTLRSRVDEIQPEDLPLVLLELGMEPHGSTARRLVGFYAGPAKRRYWEIEGDRDVDISYTAVQIVKNMIKRRLVD